MCGKFHACITKSTGLIDTIITSHILDFVRLFNYYNDLMQ